jgi:hypothetical protein
MENKGKVSRKQRGEQNSVDGIDISMVVGDTHRDHTIPIEIILYP